ncbi:MAG: NmrA/HSCARG family protein [Elusimicrobia bacterium]|nr:NmrA/HSCARG family protein [Elusimicrobiota bacterium]
MPKTISVLITGATGKQGGSLARELLKKGHRVRAFTRRPDSAPALELKRMGADLAVGNFDDRDSVHQAAQGMDAVFAMSTPFEGGMEAEVRQGFLLVDAVKSAGIQHLVYTSVGSADQGTGIPHFESKWRIENRIREKDVPYTVLGPVFFMENFFTPWMLPELQEGRITMALPPQRPLQQIALENIGQFAALVLERRSEFLGRRIDIASDELPGVRAAEILSNKTGRRIVYNELPLSQLQAANEDFAKMFDWFNRVGYHVDLNALRTNYPEVPWKTFEQWAKSFDMSVLEQTAGAR